MVKHVLKCQNSVEAVLNWAKSQLSISGIGTPITDARLLLGFALGSPQERFYGLEDKILNASEIDTYQNIVKRRCSREPVSRIIGRRDFWSLTLQLNSSSLDPRADSETLIEGLKRYMPNKGAHVNIIDLGTGTGCLLLAALKEFPNSYGVGIDISEECIKLAQENATQNKLSSRAVFLQSDWGQKVYEKFDIILSNPPYIEEDEIQTLEPEVKNFDPQIALNGGKDGLSCYRKLGDEFGSLLKKKGLVFLEIGHKQRDQVSDIMALNGLKCLSVEQDLGQRDRCLVLTNDHS
jgi:release factor glutamine methyltransferase